MGLLARLLLLVAACWASQEDLEFSITLQKPDGAKFGAKLIRASDALEVLTLSPGGLFTIWNEENPQQALKVGDRILEVNGASGSGDHLTKELQSKSTLTMKILRTTRNKPRWRAKKYRETDGVRPVYGGYLTSDALENQGFVGPVEDDDWDVLFTHYPMGGALKQQGLPKKRKAGERPRFANHCEYFRGAGQKCWLQDHLDKVVLQQGNTEGQPRYLEAYNIGKSAGHAEWIEAARRDPKKRWLLKPCAAGHSKGIEVFKGADWERVDKQHAVLQEYVQQPYLLEGRKFHLRVYFFATRWAQPVGAFFFNEGLIFHSAHKYNHKKDVNMKRDVFSGLTEDVRPVSFGSLWDHLDAECDAKGGSTPRSETVWQRILALMADAFSNPELTFGDAAKAEENRGYACSDFFGLDLMLTEDLWPVLLEINMGPNLWADQEGSENVAFLNALKKPLVEQMIHWTALRVKTPPTTVEEWRAQEDLALANFSRVL